jgi:DNA-binding transcriptional LysR family regulator
MLANACSVPLVRGLKIEAELASLSEMRGKPAANFRITTSEHAAEAVLWPALAKFLSKYPDIKVELIIDLATHSRTRLSPDGPRQLRLARRYSFIVLDFQAQLLGARGRRKARAALLQAC